MNSMEKMPRSIIDENNEILEHTSKQFENANREVIGDEISRLMKKFREGEIDEAGVAEGEKKIHDLVSEQISATMNTIKGMKKTQDSERGIQVEQ